MADLSVFSQNLGIDAKVGLDKAKSALSGGFNKLTSSFSSAFGNIKSTFEKKALPAVPSASAAASSSPEEKRVQSQSKKYAGAIMYPADMKYFTKFTFKAYKRTKVTEGAKDLPTVDIILPMPANLAETFGVTYQTPELGAIAGSAAGSIIGALRQGEAVAGVEAGGKSFLPSLAAGTQLLAQTALKAGTEFVAGRGAGQVAGSITQLTTGSVANPHIAVLFQNVNLREHQFSYKFAPNSYEELMKLKDIIKQLKTRILPGVATGQDILFTFPDVCDITFGPKATSPYAIKRCVMTNLSVNYAPNGPAFFKTGDPVMVEISMTFKEMSVFTRNDIRD